MSSMPASPVLPSEIKAILPEGDDTLCQLIVKFLRLVILFHEWYSYAYASDGSFSTAFRTDVCTVVDACT